MPRGFSRAVSRFLRSLHLKSRVDGDAQDDDQERVSSGSLKPGQGHSQGHSHGHGHSRQQPTQQATQRVAMRARQRQRGELLAASRVPDTVPMPSGLARLVRRLVDQVAQLESHNQPHSNSSSRSSLRRHHAAVLKTMERVEVLLRDQFAAADRDASPQPHYRRRRHANGRSVPLADALPQLLAVWQSALQCLELARQHTSSAPPFLSSSSSSPSLDRLSASTNASASTSTTSSDAPHAPLADSALQMDRVARALLALLLARKEFDFALMAVAHGACAVHDGASTPPPTSSTPKGQNKTTDKTKAMRNLSARASPTEDDADTEDEPTTSTHKVRVTIARRSRRQSSVVAPGSPSVARRRRASRASSRYTTAGMSSTSPCIQIKPAATAKPFASGRRGGSAAATSLCALARQSLELHHATFLLLLVDGEELEEEKLEEEEEEEEEASELALKKTRRWRSDDDRALLAQLLAVSFLRVPALREATLASCQRHVAQSPSPSRRRRLPGSSSNSNNSNNSSSVEARLRAAVAANDLLFQWPQRAPSMGCGPALAPWHRETAWQREDSFARAALRGAGFQRVFLAQLLGLLLASSSSPHAHEESRPAVDAETPATGVQWSCVPGAPVLKRMVLTVTRDLYLSQLRATDPALQQDNDVDDGAEGAALRPGSSSGSGSGSGSGGAAALDDASATAAVFLQQVMRVLALHPAWLSDWLLTLLMHTNYLRAHHVALCLQYLAQLVSRFPHFFGDTNPTHPHGQDHDQGHDRDRSHVDDALLLHVLATLLRSQHGGVLKSALLFLLQHWSALSSPLRQALLQDVLAKQMPRLLVHWHRDVRFCFAHVLLYLTYPGNRIVLGAPSDERLLGAAGARLFEIPGLVRGATAARSDWQAFDEPLMQLLARYSRELKRAKQASPPLRATVSMRTMPMGPAAGRGHGSARLAPTAASRAGRRALGTGPMGAPRNSMPAMPMNAAGSRPTATATATPAPKPVPAPLQPLAPWVEALPWASVQRAVDEYRGHVETYFQSARRISLHERVPTPLLGVK